jgi:hypothetical protein
LSRYEELGEEGLGDGSSRPKHCPHETNADVVGKIMYLRQNYHFGPYKFSMYLKRYHDIDISKSGVWRILHRLDLGRLPASQRHKAYDRRWKRYEKTIARASGPDRRQIHRTDRWSTTQALLPVHGNR